MALNGATMSVYQSFMTIVGTCAVAIPIAGIFVRWRAHYNPKGIELKDTDNAPQTRKITNVFQMAKKVYRVEGFEGLYKGLMPTILSVLIVLPVASLLELASRHVHINPPHWTLSLALRILGTVLLALACLPLSVLYIRSVTTPYRLPWFSPIRSLRVLLSPKELCHPWIVYATPGLALVSIAELLIYEHVMSKAHGLLFSIWYKDELYWRIPALIFAVPICFIVTPAVDVMKSKLSVQQNSPAPALPVSQETIEAPQAEEFSTVDVVNFRQEPYTGWCDCATKIVKEEGPKSLVRLWWVNAVAVVFVVSSVYNT